MGSLLAVTGIIVDPVQNGLMELDTIAELYYTNEDIKELIDEETES